MKGNKMFPQCGELRHKNPAQFRYLPMQFGPNLKGNTLCVQVSQTLQ